MNGTIIVGMTDTPAARRAADWASQRAVDRHDRLVLVAVVGGAIGVVGEGAIVEEALQETNRFLTREAERVGAHDTQVRRGKPVGQLIEASEHADLLVIGSDYRGPHSGPARGQHGIRIVAGAHCPVVVVPHTATETGAGVVVGVDGSEVSEAAVAFAAAEAERLGEPLTAVCVWTPLPVPFEMNSYPEDYVENMQKLTEEALALSLAGLRQDYPDLEMRRVVEAGYPAAVINRVAVGARLTVVGSHGRGRIARFLLGSVSEEVVTRLATATVVVR